MKTVLFGGLLALLAALAWLGMDAASFGRIVQRQAGAVAQSLKSAVGAPALLATPAGPSTPAATKGSSALRKCVDAGRVQYTDGPCPAGSLEQTLKGDVSVLPAAPAAAVPVVRPAGPPPEASPRLPGPDAGDAR